MKIIMTFAGLVFSAMNMLPIPWRLRLIGLRVLYFIIAQSTLIFPSILQWTKSQNIRYKMGKQEGEDYESLVQLEKVLEFLETSGVSIQAVKHAVEQAEVKRIPYEEYGTFIAKSVLDPITVERVLKASLQSVRY